MRSPTARDAAGGLGRRLSPEDQAKLAAILRWRRRNCDSGQIVRIMGLVEGWVVARFRGSAPFLRHANDWLKEFEPAEAAAWEALPGHMVSRARTTDGGEA